MALKKKSKVSAEFSMSSLTDIIFLLLIFFMLTSSVIVPNALNMKIPGGQSSAVVESTPEKITIRGKETIRFADKTFNFNIKDPEAKAKERKRFEKAVRDYVRRSGKRSKDLDMTLTPSRSATTEAVAIVMDVMQKVEVNCILALPE